MVYYYHDFTNTILIKDNDVYYDAFTYKPLKQYYKTLINEPIKNSIFVKLVENDMHNIIISEALKIKYLKLTYDANRIKITCGATIIFYLDNYIVIYHKNRLCRRLSYLQYTDLKSLLKEVSNVY